MANTPRVRGRRNGRLPGSANEPLAEGHAAPIAAVQERLARKEWASARLRGLKRASRRAPALDGGPDTVPTKSKLQAPSPIALVDEHTQDRWLDHLIEYHSNRHTRWQRLRHEMLRYPHQWLVELWKYLRTTPGKMTAMVVFLMVTILAAGLSMSQYSAQRRAELDTLLHNTEPVSYLAHNLYSDLSLANTIATVGFVSNGVESSGNRERYGKAIQEAAIAAVQTAGGMEDNDGRPLDLVTTINQNLPLYAGWVETAWTNARQGNPVSISYMSEASSRMLQTILPAASELYTLTTQSVRSEQRTVSRPQWIPLSGLIAALVFLGLAQVWLARTTRRRLNAGFLLATVLMAVATSWACVANIVTWQLGVRGYEQAAGPMEQLTDARILAQQARSTETMALVRRQSLEDSNRSFQSTVEQVQAALDDYAASPLAEDPENARALEGARSWLHTWTQDHTKIAAALNRGDYDTAIRLAASTSSFGEQTSTFAQLDTTLAALISDARSTTRMYIEQGVSASSRVSVVVLVLSIISVLSLWMGIRPRLQEYL